MLISVIIPCYNVQDYIEECIASISHQSYKKIEVICIDNNSTDETWIKLEQLRTIYPALLVEQETKPGAPAARNKGLSLAKGKWIQFLDADDLLLPSKIEQQVKLLSNSSTAAFVVGACIKRNLTGKEKVVIPKDKDPIKALFSADLGNTCSNLWNRKYLEKIQGWDETLKSSQEADLMFKILQINEIVIYDSEPTTIVRERISGQISQRDPREKWLQFLKTRIEIFDWLEQTKPQYLKDNHVFFKETLFGIIKIIASLDLNLAEQLYKIHLGKTFKPGKCQNHSTISYLALFNFFGFKNTERIKKKLKLFFDDQSQSLYCNS